MSNDDVNALKASRKALKGALTKEINASERYMAEDEKDEVKKRFKKIKEKFENFEKKHDEYHERLIDEIERDASDEYFYEVQRSYVDSIRTIKQWLASAVETKPVENVKPAAKEDISRNELLGILNLPKVELEVFDGEPLRYHSFLALFDEHVHTTAVDPSVKLTRLLQCTKGRAKEAIRYCALIGGEDGYKEARSILESRFGSDHLIAEKIIRSLKNGKAVRSADDLQQLADELRNCYATLLRMKRLKEVDTQSSIVEIVNRLQPFLKNRWKRHVFDHKEQTKEYPDFGQFVKFMAREAEQANDPVYGAIGGSAKPQGPAETRNRSVTSFTTEVKGAAKSWACLVCGQNHRLFACDKFRAMKPYERLNFVKTHGLCENCLFSNHKTQDCRKPSVCSVPGCGQKHTKFIHLNENRSSSLPPINPSNVNATVNQVRVEEPRDSSCEYVEIRVPVVKVIANGTFETCALLDSGSTTSFCTQRLVDRLGIVGSDVSYTLSTLNLSQQTKTSKLVNVELTSTDGSGAMKLSNVYVVDQIPVPKSKVSTREYSHLKHLPITDCNSQVDVLIGQDNSEALVPLEIRKGEKGDPFAIRTVLGWSVNGPVSSTRCINRSVISNFVTVDPIKRDVENLWNIENENVSREKSGWSQSDREVIELWDKTVVKVNGHYQLPIPWRSGVTVPNNMVVALSRLKSLRVSLIKRGMMQRYSEEIAKLCDLGYAERVPLPDVTEGRKIWYLPHHAVVSDSKPGKLRIVFDCASKFCAESLNEKCCQGPDLNNKLLHVLLRFRNHSYAITADIEAMYYQVLVSPDDVDCLRFLWFNETGDDVQQYRMLRHVFGGVWSGSAAIYALHRTVLDLEADPEVRNVVLRSFYVDDCLVSVESCEIAKRLLSDTRDLLLKGGFRLTKFVSNCEEILSEIPTTDRAEGAKDFGSEAKSKVLGLKWKVRDDQFYFDVNLNCPQKVTRRTVLSVVSSLFDPLGLISPVLISGKIIFQDCTILRMDWDEVLPPEFLKRWNSWIDSLQVLKNVSVARCVKSSKFDDSHMELHHFSDASDRAYGCCSYLRCINHKGMISVELLCSKGRVAPVNTVSIPRLELQAAVLAARMDSMLKEELHLSLGQSTFWIDSEVALSYIKSDSRRFQVFVANRVSEIRNLTSPDQWKHVPGKENPADIITRGQQPDDLFQGSWFHGPDFLHFYKGQWTSNAEIPDVAPDDPEVKKCKDAVCLEILSEPMEHPIDTLISYCSSWLKLKRAVGWLLRIRCKLLKRQTSSSSKTLTPEEIKEAEELVIKHVQQRTYAEEYQNISNNSGKSSRFRELSPFIDSKGLIRVGGRLQHAGLVYEGRHPCIIPHNDGVAKLIALDFHNIGHFGTEWTLSLIRRRYWITRARGVIKKIKNNCVTCRKLFANPQLQKMADLPPERSVAGKPPFFFTGVDCFGPFNCKVGRTEIKRYGCVFTCMNIRAVHIEKLDSLDTDSFLNGFRRFAARRGMPKMVWSDNGKNFVGALNEVNRSLKSIDQEKVRSFAIKCDIDWIFIPPGAPHWGGVWERMVKTIKRVLTVTLRNTRLTDEILSTFFCEAENMINGRPITKISNDPNDVTPLTPNHLLMFGQGPPPPPGNFCIADIYRRRWRHVQFLCDQFWKRWVREYLPTLQTRNKWFQVRSNLEVGDIVLLVDENTPRSIWPMGIVEETRPGRDGLVRSVHVRTKSKVLVRPISKIVFIEGHRNL